MKRSQHKGYMIMKTFELTRPIGAPYFNFDELVQDTQLVASVIAENITEAIEKLQNEECITMHIVSVNEETNIADVDIPLRNSNWGWGMGYVMAA
tara:strand:- start:978 stop:1262 length:285 start_codon:yes stop_codon:yes gene_type:complete